MARKTKLTSDGKLLNPVLFTVEGCGAFFFDMLRYDSCIPHTEVDSNLLGRWDDGGKPRLITLRTFSAHAPTPARWQSRGWRVVSILHPIWRG